MALFSLISFSWFNSWLFSKILFEEVLLQLSLENRLLFSLDLLGYFWFCEWDHDLLSVIGILIFPILLMALSFKSSYVSFPSILSILRLKSRLLVNLEIFFRLISSGFTFKFFSYCLRKIKYFFWSLFRWILQRRRIPTGNFRPKRQKKLIIIMYCIFKMIKF